MPTPDAAEHSPSAARNRAPILAALREVLPARGLVLEVASGTGEHAAFFAARLPGLTWQPSEHPARSPASISAHRIASGCTNLLPPLVLDASASTWPIETADAIVAVNMVHIAPWSATHGLMRGVARVLRPEGRLILYGPFLEDDVPLAASNAAFDADLRRRDPAWGLRRREDVEACASAVGLRRLCRIAMPANNLLLVWGRQDAAGEPS